MGKIRVVLNDNTIKVLEADNFALSKNDCLVVLKNTTKEEEAVRYKEVKHRTWYGVEVIQRVPETYKHVYHVTEQVAVFRSDIWQFVVKAESEEKVEDFPLKVATVDKLMKELPLSIVDRVVFKNRLISKGYMEHSYRAGEEPFEIPSS